MLLTIILSALTACTKDEDFRVSKLPDSEKAIVPTTITVLQQHTKGRGIPVVIMGDGYTQADITNGTYRSVTTAAMEALFCEAPMSKLRDYVDVYEATAASAVRGITKESQNTVFQSYIPNDGSTNIYCNDSIALEYALYALYEKEDKSTLVSRSHDMLAIVILNSDVYAGVTKIDFVPTTSDIPSGLSISYIPERAKDRVTQIHSNGTKTYVTKSALNTLVQHEVIGHGLAKLGDEYSYIENGQASASVVENYEKFASYGGLKNISRNKSVNMSPWATMAADERYADEGLRCIEGAYTYTTGFYRPTMRSIMNSETSGFNAPSRYAIYQRVMRIANGEKWQPNYEEFVAFDLSGTQTASAAKGTRGAYYYEQADSLPHLAPPRLLEY